MGKILYQTLALKPLDRMLDYLELIQSGDWKLMRFHQEPQEVFLDDFDYNITNFLLSHEVAIDVGVYKFINPDNENQYVYGHVNRNKVIDRCFFDDEQVKELDKLITYEQDKLFFLNELLEEELTSDVLPFKRNKIKVLENIYQNTDWELKFHEDMEYSEQNNITIGDSIYE